MFISGKTLKILLLSILITMVFLQFFEQRNVEGVVRKVNKDHFFSQEFSNNNLTEYESLLSTKTNIPHIIDNANQGDSNSMTELASIIAKGALLKRNYTKAIKWYEKAIDLGNVKAIIGLSDLYYDIWQDTGNIHYLKQSVKLLEDNLNKNNPQISYKLGIVLYDTKKERKNQGLELIKKSANQNYIPAILDLAAIYKNKKESELLLRKAWDLGSDEAGFILEKISSQNK